MHHLLVKKKPELSENQMEELYQNDVSHEGWAPKSGNDASADSVPSC